MNRVELLSSKFNKFIKRDYPIIKDNKIHDYWLKRFNLDVFNWLDIRKDLKSFSKMYYNEKIQNFICKVLLV